MPFITRPIHTVILLLSVFAGAASAADSTLFRPLSPETADLNTYRWHNRPVVIFAPSKQDSRYQQQITLLESQKTALTERDIIVLSDTSPGDKGQLRSQLKPKGFEVVLVGKDGGMKLRETTPLSAEVLLSTIDNMPMRKTERHQ
ncbi:hypothetical protein PRCB_22655 [Pantoea rodasii]|uniref:DUF4174 domain-containing protein n=1 Tax=Pantoea rodasii TaxID=1076549 RepID=A0A2M9W7A3_9GAMM|nr:DUF4174 domain-containing protein [Pantoea rodasii]ORM65384.1 hypothetical protein HA45_05610 [Pantoea rodasii]PJZ03384.1 hypothetical protein PRCB_22655 [Pantoea rodasii]